MLCGACVGFTVAAQTGNPALGLAAGALAGLALSLVHGGLCLRCKANQIGSGIAVWTLGLGLTSYFGRSAVGAKVTGLAPLAGPRFADLPIAGPMLVQLTPVAPLSIIILLLAGFWLYRTRTGLNWRIVGESVATGRALGIRTLLVGISSAKLTLYWTLTFA